MARRKNQENQRCDALYILALDENFDSSNSIYMAEVERLMKMVENAKSKQRNAEAEYENSRDEAVKNFFGRFLSALKFGFKDRALILGILLFLKTETEKNPDSELILTCYSLYDDYVNNKDNKWADRDYLPAAVTN